MKKRAIVIFILAAVMITALLLAACSPKEYKVAFDLGAEAEAAGIDMEPIMASVITKENAPVPPTWAGHSFVSWHTSDKLDAASRVAYPFTVTQDTVLYAKWIVSGDNIGQEYKVSFVTNGGLPLADITVSVIQSEPQTTKSGYKFIGWYTDSATETGKISFPYTVTEETTLYAKWKDETNGTFMVTFNTNGGSAVEAIEVAIDDSIQTAPSTFKSNANFDGWYDNSVLKGKPVTFPFTPTDDCTLYAKWKVNQTITADQVNELKGYLQGASYQNYAANYLLQIQVQDNSNVFHTQYMAASTYKFVGNSLLCISPLMNDDGEFIQINGHYVYGREYCFERPDHTYMLYAEDTQGNYQCNDGITDGLYSAQALTSSNLETYFRMIYAQKLALLNANNFYPYDGKWYVKDDYVDEYGNIMLGNSSGDPSTFTSHYSSLAFTFNASGVLTGIDAESTVTRMTDIGNGQAITYYYYTHKITISDVGETTLPTEDDFIQDQDRPSGVYPGINENDPNRPNVTWDSNAYTAEQLASAISQLNNATFQAYYTELSNYYGTISSFTTTLHNNGNYGSSIEHRDSDVTCYYSYDENTDAFFYAIPNSNGDYTIWCSQYTYKTNYYYNQYLLGVDSNGAYVGFNYAMPAPALGNLNAADFTYNADGHYFEMPGDTDELTFIGKALFGNADYDYPGAGQHETYTYIRLYLKNGSLVRVLAGSDMLYDDGWTEYFVRELLVSNESAQTVAIPSSVSAQFIAPGEAKVGGSTGKFASALVNTGSNFTYSDQFVYDDTDELGGVYTTDNGANADLYKYTDSLTWIMGDHYAFFENGALKVNYLSGGVRTTYNVDPAFTANDIEKLNEWISWIKPITIMLNADWFYEGKDGKFYGRAEYMEELSAVIGRYSGSESYLEGQAGLRFSNSYRWTVNLDYAAITLGGSVDSPTLSNIYYSGVIHVRGLSGSHDKPFSGTADFYNIGSTSLTLPTGAGTADAARPKNIKNYLVANYNFSVDDNNVLRFDEIAGAGGYELRLYTRTTAADGKVTYNLVDDAIAVYNGYKIADAASSLLNGELVTSYYATLTALGNAANYDAIPSDYKYIELSKYGREQQPTLELDGVNGVITVSGDLTYGFHAEIAEMLNGKINDKAQSIPVDTSNSTTTAINLADYNLVSGRTYQISVYAKGRNTQDNPTRDSLTSTITYTHNTGKHYAMRLFEAIDFSQSFNFDASSQAGTYNYVINDFNSITDIFDDAELKSLAADYCWLNFRYHQPTNRGKFKFVIYDANGSMSDSKSLVGKWVYEFSVQGDKLVGALTTTTKQGSSTQGGVTFNKLPFATLKNLDMTKFEEVRGDLRDYRGVIYEYTDMGAATQEILRQATFIGQFAVDVSKLTFDGLRVQVAYNKDDNGNLTTMAAEQSITIIAHDDEGVTYTIKYRFGDFNKVAADWPDKLDS